MRKTRLVNVLPLLFKNVFSILLLYWSCKFIFHSLLYSVSTLWQSSTLESCIFEYLHIWILNKGSLFHCYYYSWFQKTVKAVFNCCEQAKQTENFVEKLRAKKFPWYILFSLYRDFTKALLIYQCMFRS